jgi:hypothetical protein
MAKTKKIEEAVEEVQVEETVQETVVVEETPKVPQNEDGITDRAYTSLKYKK